MEKTESERGSSSRESSETTLFLYCSRRMAQKVDVTKPTAKFYTVNSYHRKGNGIIIANIKVVKSENRALTDSSILKTKMTHELFVEHGRSSPCERTRGRCSWEDLSRMRLTL